MDVLALERAYWEAMKNGDSEGVEKLTDESCIVVGPEGIGEFDPKTVGAMVEDMPYELQSYEIGQDAKVRMLGRNVTLVAYPVHESLHRDGTPEVLDAIGASRRPLDVRNAHRNDLGSSVSVTTPRHFL